MKEGEVKEKKENLAPEKIERTRGWCSERAAARFQHENGSEAQHLELRTISA